MFHDNLRFVKLVKIHLPLKVQKTPLQKQYLVKIMTNNASYLTQQDLQFHVKNPANFGLLPDLDFVSGEHNPSCGDLVIVGGKVLNGNIVRLCFQGSGCVISMAMASKLTIACVGMSLNQVLSLDDAMIEKLLGLQLGINRMKCGLLSIMALQKGIELYQKKAKELASIDKI